MTVGDQQLLDRLFAPSVRGHLIGHRDSNTDVIGRQVAELDERAEGLIEIARLLHALGIREEVRACIRQEALLGPDLTDLEVRLVTLRNIPNDLLADRDRVVGKVGLTVEVYGLLVVLDRLIQLTDPHIEIPNAVIQADVDLLLARQFRKRLVVLLEGLLPVLFLLVLARLSLERFDAHSVMSEISVCPPLRADTYSAARWERTRVGPRSRSFNLPAVSGNTRASGIMPITSVSSTEPPIWRTCDSISVKTASGDVRAGSSRFMEI